ncbi:uncharacterized protein B0T23DRAFT_373413 [Neurospora hispaniola]|uniref:Uncharacterized protein n=1 Tax=Neurospora hispaniola TaxID=588809 RepID=A0AAJ0MTJ8_9PEZI|nr:hypothetical protein B0T23DRAFT_373413 [Neurospora hispaniola]
MDPRSEAKAPAVKQPPNHSLYLTWVKRLVIFAASISALLLTPHSPDLHTSQALSTLADEFQRYHN